MGEKMDAPHTNVIRPNRVLLATDGSQDAELAARVATDLSRRTGAQLHVAHAWRHHVRGFGYPTVVWTDYSYIYEREARRLLEAEIDAIEAAGVVAEPHLLHGPPIDAILDLCDEIRPGLVVMGSRGLGPVGRIIVGSVSEGVVHHARCPVLVARGG
ncbi:MAG TPA: universal stress protein, partial [Rubrobacter sp.]|nr:universal stress protein [Rubrobacter sp.]